MEKKLQYFDYSGYAEPIRYMLHYAGEKFEDIRHDFFKWPIENIKDSLPYGQFPLYEEGNRTLNQSIAIARYVASQTNLLPKDPWDQAVLDAIVLTIYDIWAKISVYYNETDPVKQAAIKKEFLEEHIDFFFSRFEKELKEHNGHFGGQLTWADFMLVGIVEASFLVFGKEVEKDYPYVQSLVQKIRTSPGVKEYISTRKSD